MRSLLQSFGGVATTVSSGIRAWLFIAPDPNKIPLNWPMFATAMFGCGFANCRVLCEMSGRHAPAGSS